MMLTCILHAELKEIEFEPNKFVYNFEFVYKFELIYVYYM